MNNKELPSMQTVTALAKFLIITWRESKCPYTDAPLYACAKCKYDELCTKIEELEEVVTNEYL